MSDKKEWSEEKTDILGHKYAQHYDEHGDKTGWSEGRTGILGDKYTQEYDRGPAGIRASQEGEPEKSRHSGARSRTSYSQGSSPSFSTSPNSAASSSSGLSIPGVVGSVIVLGIVAVFIYNALPPSVTTLPKIQKSASGQSCAPVEVIAPGACPFEGCQYGKWTAREAVPIYSIPGGPVLKGGIGRGQAVTAASGEVWATPRKATVTKVYKTDTEQGINVGSVVYVLYPLGEGAVAVWHEGKVKEGSLDLNFHYDQPLEPLHWTWWVRVGLPDGTAGWVKNPHQHHFQGMDRFGQ